MWDTWVGAAVEVKVARAFLSLSFCCASLLWCKKILCEAAMSGWAVHGKRLSGVKVEAVLEAFRLPSPQLRTCPDSVLRTAAVSVVDCLAF